MVKRFCLVSWTLLIGSLAAAQVVIAPTGKQDTRTRIAVPAFAAAPGLETLGRELAEVMRYDLVFMGQFVIVPESGYPKGFRGLEQDAAKIDLHPWRRTEAELLVHGYLSADAGTDRLVLEARLLDVASGSMVVGRKLDVGQKFSRMLAHSFSDEVVLYATGTTGIATSQFCFSAGTPPKKELYIADYDGANLRRVTLHNSISIRPKFSPDGKWVAFTA